MIRPQEPRVAGHDGEVDDSNRTEAHKPAIRVGKMQKDDLLLEEVLQNQ